MVLEPSTGRVAYANAGHNLPIVRTDNGVIELRATGMPLGLLPDRTYDEKQAILGRNQSLLLYSDGIDEAHDPSGDMFGTPRLRGLMAAELAGSELIDHLLDALHRFVGRDWDQEDDITLVAIERTGEGDAMGPHLEARQPSAPPAIGRPPASVGDRVLLRLTIPGAEGSERMAMDSIAEAVAPLALESTRLERLKTAVSEAAMNAIEYGSKSDPAIPVDIEVALANGDLVVRITDRGLSGGIPAGEEPNLEAKLAGEQKPRGWGLFLIRHMVDTMEVVTEGPSQTVTLTLHLEGDGHADQPVQR
jgi:anti-sigma regulatory factor (Ser/Thr protein kinase)